MLIDVIFFLSLLLTALALAPALAHALELPHKIKLPAREYLSVQRLYRGWAALGLIAVAALAATAALAYLVSEYTDMFVPTLIAASCIAGTLVVFLGFTFPVNLKTGNWTMLPADWPELRRRWEFSHAAGAALYVLALMALIVAVLAR
jgi:hypothetical protein